MAASIPYIEPAALAEVLRGPERSSTLVIDVRDEDFDGGHIKGAKNIGSEKFYQDSGVDAVIDEHFKPPVTKVVLHCMFSQQRGPRCASRLAKRLQERGLQEPSLLVLRGGFVQFVRMHGSEADLVEGVNSEVWD